MWLLVCAGVVVLIKARRREGTDPTCGRCGYNLTGSQSNRCPECGALFIEAGVTMGKRPGSARWLVVSLVVLSILFVGAISLTNSYWAAASARAQATRAAMQTRMRAIETQAAAAEAQQQKASEQPEDGINDAGEP